MSDSPSVPADNTADEVEALRKRNAELEQQVASNKKTRGWRMYLALVVVVLFGIALIPANQAAWLATTTLDTDNFVSTFGPLPSDEAVARALGTGIAAQVAEEAALDEVLASRLPSELQFIAAPVAGAVETLIAEAATRIISSDQFDAIWNGALRGAHQTAITVIEKSRSGAISAQDGQVILDLSELVQQVDERLQERGIDVINPEEIDATIVLYESEELGLVQSIINIVYSIRWVAPIAVLILLAGAILIASDRRKVTIWLGIATIVAMVLTLIEIRLLRNSVLGEIVDPVYQDGAAAAWNIVMDRLLAQTWGLLILGLVAALVAWFFGPSERAGSIRESFVNARNSSRGDAELSPTATFIHKYRRVIEWVAVGLGALVLLLAPTISGLMVIVVAALVIAVIAGVEWIGGAGSQSDIEDSDTSETTKDSVDA